MTAVDHLPINHQLRPLWRGLAFLAGLYVLLLGIFGFIAATSNKIGWFQQTDLPTALGLKVNPAFGLLSIIVGAIIVLASLVGRNIDRFVNFAFAPVFLLAGAAMLLVIRTDMNYFAFTVGTSIVSFIIGFVLMTAALYGRVGLNEHAQAEEDRRHRVMGLDRGPVDHS